MLLQERVWPIYCLSANPKIRLWYCRLRYASNTRVVPVFRLVDRINLGEVIDFNESNSSDSESENKDSDNEPVTINKVKENDLKCIEWLYEAFIKSKYMLIVKSKKMILIIKRLQEVHADI